MEETTPFDYAFMVADGLKSSGLSIVPLRFKTSAADSCQMNEYLKKYVFSRTPDWLVLCCGIQDISRQNPKNSGTSPENFKQNLLDILETCRQQQIRVILMTPPLYTEDPFCLENQTLALYADIIRETAATEDIPLADVNRLMLHVVKHKPYPEQNYLTSDGLHLNARGSILAATAILQALHVPKSIIKQSVSNWMSQPDTVRIPVTLHMSLYDLEKLQTLTSRNGQTEEAWVNKLLQGCLNKDATNSKDTE